MGAKERGGLGSGAMTSPPARGRDGGFAKRLAELGWHEWLAHSYFSFLLGASSPAQLLERAAELGYRSLCLTDLDGVYGSARAFRACRALSEKAKPASLGLQLGCGAEVHLKQDLQDTEQKMLFGAEHELPFVYQDTLALIALNATGYSNLCSLLTFAHRDSKDRAALTVSELLAQPVEGLVALQPMRGWMRRYLDPGVSSASGASGLSLRGASGQKQHLDMRFGGLRDHFAGDLYFVQSRHLSPLEDRWLPVAAQLAQRFGCPTLLSQDAFFHTAQQKDMSDLLTAIRTRQTLEQASQSGQLFVNSRRCLHPVSQLAALYGELPGATAALECGHELSQRMDFCLSELRYAYPKEMIPDGHSPQSYLTELTLERARIRYGEPLPEKVHAALKHELALVEQLRFADYFLTVFDIVDWAKQQGILCQGRGSAANSAICFVLGITAVDPQRFELLFERFISVERGDPPDIDVDFEHERREEVIQYIYRRYGRKRAAMVCNVICFRTKGAIRAVGKALGFDEAVLKQAATLLQSRSARRSKGVELLHTLREGCSQQQIDAQRLDLWGRLSDRLKGYPRHLGIHSGGFMLSDRDLHELCPTEPATMPGRTVIQWSKEDIEALHFFKIDVLALGMLTAIRKCLENLKEHAGIQMSLASIPAEDPDTYAMIQRADTLGTFQIESRAQMSFLPKHKPRHFYDLVVEVAIIRPGPIQGGMIHPYLRRRDGLEPVTFPDPRLEPILRRTFGVPIFQEQVMRIAMAVGGFSPGEANELRKNIGSFNIKGDTSVWSVKLATGMRANGLKEEFIESLVNHVKGFSSYGFPESHAASFALLAYASSYLKCHHPEAYFAALLNSQPMGFYSPDVLIKYVSALGIEVRPICVQKSGWDHSLEPLSTSTSTSTGNKETGQRSRETGQKSPRFALRLGMRLVKGLRKTAAEDLVEKRQQGGSSWRSVEDLLDRLFPGHHEPAESEARAHDETKGCSQKGLASGQIDAGDFACLAAADALACFGLGRRAAVWLSLSVLPPLASSYDRQAGVKGLMWDDERPFDFAKETPLEKVQQDYESTSTSLGTHPAALMRKEAWLYAVRLEQLSSARHVQSLKNGAQVYIFGMVSCRQAPPTAKGVMFLTLWDESGAFDVVVRPEVRKRFARIIDYQGFLCIKGRMQVAGEARSILAQHVYAPELAGAEVKSMQSLLSSYQQQRRFVRARNYM